MVRYAADRAGFRAGGTGQVTHSTGQLGRSQGTGQATTPHGRLRTSHTVAGTVKQYSPVILQFEARTWVPDSRQTFNKSWTFVPYVHVPVPVRVLASRVAIRAHVTVSRMSFYMPMQAVESGACSNARAWCADVSALPALRQCALSGTVHCVSVCSGLPVFS